jgi:hypothetical protein
MLTRLRKFPNIYVWATVGLGALPFLIYVCERKFGSLPSAEVWYATGTNHGPWRWNAEGFAVLYPLIILLCVTFGTFASRSVRNKKWSLAALGIILVLCQLGMLYAQLIFLGWTVG